MQLKCAKKNNRLVVCACFNGAHATEGIVFYWLTHLYILHADSLHPQETFDTHSHAPTRLSEAITFQNTHVPHQLPRTNHSHTHPHVYPRQSLPNILSCRINYPDRIRQTFDKTSHQRIKLNFSLVTDNCVITNS